MITQGMPKRELGGGSMSYCILELSFPPIYVGLKRVPRKLSPSYEEEEEAKHRRAWAPFEAYGIQPCGDGVQVYAQPQTPEHIRRVAKALLEVAKRIERAAEAQKG